jgi:hypothetical protein
VITRPTGLDPTAASLGAVPVVGSGRSAPSGRDRSRVLRR